MQKRGRKSAASLSVVTPLPDRPKAPSCLHDGEAAIWDQVVNSHPGGWLARDAWPLLVQYCRHVVRADRIAQAIHRYETEDHAEDGFDLSHWKSLLAIQESETRAVLACARSLRISHQARYRADSAAARPADDRPKPWEM